MLRTCCFLYAQGSIMLGLRVLGIELESTMCKALSIVLSLQLIFKFSPLCHKINLSECIIHLKFSIYSFILDLFQFYLFWEPYLVVLRNSPWLCSSWNMAGPYLVQVSNPGWLLTANVLHPVQSLYPILKVLNKLSLWPIF